jgi:hypothetical protein
MPNMPNTLWRGTYGIDIMAGSWPFRVAVNASRKVLLGDPQEDLNVLHGF